MQLLDNLFVIDFEQDCSICLCAGYHVFGPGSLVLLFGEFLDELVVFVGCIFEIVRAIQDSFEIFFVFVQHCWDNLVLIGDSACLGEVWIIVIFLNILDLSLVF